jgi:hypothetical protein
MTKPNEDYAQDGHELPTAEYEDPQCDVVARIVRFHSDIPHSPNARVVEVNDAADADWGPGDQQ